MSATWLRGALGIVAGAGGGWLLHRWAACRGGT